MALSKKTKPSKVKFRKLFIHIGDVLRGLSETGLSTKDKITIYEALLLEGGWDRESYIRQFFMSVGIETKVI